MSDVLERRWLLVKIWIAVFTIATGAANVHGHLIERNHRAFVRRELAQDCVDDWQRLDDLRRGIPIPTEALISTFPNADPKNVATFRRYTHDLLKDTFSDPECDLDDAQRELDE